jgi:DNA-binding Lrp family transcriptional regulator
MLSNPNEKRLGTGMNEEQIHSYSGIREALVGMGAKSSMIDQLSLPALTAIFEIVRNYSVPGQAKKRSGRPKRGVLAENLSPLDKKILNALLSSTGTVSSAILSREFNVPLSTVHRRRKWLESHLVDKSYRLRAESFGMRTAELFISTKNGSTPTVASELLCMRDVVFSVSRTMSESGIDLTAKVICRDHEDLANILERINSIDSVDKVRWCDYIEVIGRNNYPPSLVTS